MKELSEKQAKSVDGGASSKPNLSTNKKGSYIVFTAVNCEEITSHKIIKGDRHIYGFSKTSSKRSCKLVTSDGKAHGKSITVQIKARVKKGVYKTFPNKTVTL